MVRNDKNYNLSNYSVFSVVDEQSKMWDWDKMPTCMTGLWSSSRAVITFNLTENVEFLTFEVAITKECFRRMRGLVSKLVEVHWRFV